MCHKNSWRKFSTKNPTSAVPCQRTMTKHWEVFGWIGSLLDKNKIQKPSFSWL
jgi:hypothetical protein